MRRFAIAVALALALAGCSGSDDFPSFGESGTSTTPATSGQPGTATSVRPGSGNTFCEFLNTYNDRFGRFNAGINDPQQLRSVMNEALTSIKAAEANAPTEIRADVRTMGGAFEALVRSFEQVGFDITRLRLDQLTALQNPQVVQASERLNTYTRANCL